jgi:hypothetical protein
MAPPSPHHPAPLHFGEHRIRAGWIGIGIAAAALVMVTPPLLSVGSPEPLLAVAPILLVFAALCAITRTVTIDPAAGIVRVERRLLGLRWSRVFPLAGAYAVTAEWFWAMSRHARSDGTLLGDQRFMHYRIFLDGRPRILLDVVSSDVEAVERTVLRVACALGLPAERRGYTRVREPNEGWLAMRRKGGREIF